MNSLNILSARVSPAPGPAQSRSSSLKHVDFVSSASGDDQNEKLLSDDQTQLTVEPEEEEGRVDDQDEARQNVAARETSPLLEKSGPPGNVRDSPWHSLPRRIAHGLIGSVQWVLSTIAAPGVYLLACLYDEHGTFAPWRQLRKLFGSYDGDTRKFTADCQEDALRASEKVISSRRAAHHSKTGRPRAAGSSASSSSGLTSESESETAVSENQQGRRSSSGNNHHSRSKSFQHDESAPARRSIRIKLNSDEALRQRKHKKSQSVNAKGADGEGTDNDLSAQLKSPTSPVAALTRYPRTPAPPRPLIPRRQPSYIPYDSPDPKQLKTLVLDLDETLIHSMSKGGRMGSGHMVEVRLNTTYVGASGQQTLGPTHPILYYVHKRPHCDEFLRKISKWFNLVVFTASVQEYADPVIDWLESERKFFTARYYRQHCTFRHGAFIKDLSSVEPDLSKVMILDNSPLSYMFHQDNAIPIQGWINDPTDNDLLHLVPLLEGLQYVSDVRALLALRGGEDGQHMVA